MAILNWNYPGGYLPCSYEVLIRDAIGNPLPPKVLHIDTVTGIGRKVRLDESGEIMLSEDKSEIVSEEFCVRVPLLAEVVLNAEDKNCHEFCRAINEQDEDSLKRFA